MRCKTDYTYCLWRLSSYLRRKLNKFPEIYPFLGCHAVSKSRGCDVLRWAKEELPCPSLEDSSFTEWVAEMGVLLIAWSVMQG